MELPGPLLLLLLAVLADGGAVQGWSQKDPSRPSEIDGHIFGGRDAKTKEFPHMVSMQLWKPSKYLFLQKPSHQCGGALVAKNWVLTAAHCFIGVDSSVKVEVLVGAISLEAGRLGAEGAQRVEVARIVKHAKYDGDIASVGPYDIGMLKLVKEVQLNEYVQLAQLPVPGSIPTGDLILTGWGVTDRGIPDILKVATLPVLPYSECLRIMRQSGYENFLHETNVCNGPLNGDRGSCTGDSGGPLIQWLNGKAVVTAAVSWGPGGCFPSSIPTVNVRVSAFVDWIHDVMNFY